MRFITTLPLPQFDDLHSLLPSTLLWLQYLLSLVPLSGCSSGWTEGGRARRSLEYELGGGGWVKSNRIVSYRMLDLVVTCYAMLCGGDIVQVRSDPNPLVILPTSGISCVLCCAVLSSYYTALYRAGDDVYPTLSFFLLWVGWMPSDSIASMPRTHTASSCHAHREPVSEDWDTLLYGTMGICTLRYPRTAYSRRLAHDGRRENTHTRFERRVEYLLRRINHHLNPFPSLPFPSLTWRGVCMG